VRREDTPFDRAVSEVRSHRIDVAASAADPDAVSVTMKLP
jgi:hypothetical protein